MAFAYLFNCERSLLNNRKREPSLGFVRYYGNTLNHDSNRDCTGRTGLVCQQPGFSYLMIVNPEFSQNLRQFTVKQDIVLDLVD
jgi:hypothetical protein